MNTNNMITFNSENRQAIQNCPSTQVLHLNELKLFYQAPNDNNFYHVTCKIILQDYQSENSVPWDDDNYDYEFFFQNYHVTCKLLTHSLVLNILNKEIYGRDFDINDLKRKYLLLTSRQKLNLELNLKQILPLYLPQYSIPDISDGETKLNNDKFLDSSHNENNITSYSMINNNFDNDNGWQCNGSNDYISQRDENETGIYTRHVNHSQQHFDFPQYPNFQQ
ncbi:hypothetical protein C1645_802246 [Glomus cerebriforme]|uniref:Uncharacterized protein n=1 Tax=Glomus cerebriforme TaxID=658196 RepID=A0A397TJS2_9GLOM|nr:hypothetical protein C1645_802246 [Glomus cerebriforme]